MSKACFLQSTSLLRIRRNSIENLIQIKKKAQKYLATLAEKDRLRIIGAIDLLGQNPLPPKALKLTGREGYRIRVGDYRIIYSFISQQLSVLVIKIGGRKDIYE